MAEVTYASREAVKRSLDIAQTASIDGQVDEIVASSSREAESLLHRIFWPRQATRLFDRPAWQRRTATWRLWLDADEVITVDSVTVGNETIPTSALIPKPATDNGGAPFDELQIDRSTSYTFEPDSAGTHQQQVAVTGLFGWNDAAKSIGALNGPVAALDGSITIALTVATVETGQLLRVNDERMIIADRQLGDTARTSTVALSSTVSDSTITLGGAGSVLAGEIIQIDNERMRVDVVGDTQLIVTRAFDGSTLAAHLAGAPIFAYRTFTVDRAAGGTTAAGHADLDPVTVWVAPSPLRAYTRRLSIARLLDERSGMARELGQGEGAVELAGHTLAAAQANAVTTIGRFGRQR